MIELLWPLWLFITGVCLMAVAGLTGSPLAFYSGLAVSGTALVSLIRLTLKESD